MKLRRKKRDYIEEVRTNPNVYCSCVCCETYCEKRGSEVTRMDMMTAAWT